MTCIVGVAHEGRVVIGADSAGSDGWGIQTTRTDNKLIVRQDIEKKLRMVFGFAGCYRGGQLLRHDLKLPDPPRVGESVEGWLVCSLVENVRQCFRRGGVLKKDNEVTTTEAMFLVAYQGRLFYVGTDFQVGESADGESAIGSGYQLALGSLHTTRGTGWTINSRVTHALQSAEHYNTNVRGPFHVEELCDG